MEFIKEYLDLGALVTQVAAFLPQLGVSLAILLLFWLFYRVTGPALRRLLGRVGIEPVLTRLLVDNFYRFALFAFGIVTAAGQVGINVGAAVAGLGVAGIAIGFAAQDSLANTIAGVMIFWDQPFIVGDIVSVADQYGRVTNITMRSTRIRTPRNTYVVIPNKMIIDEVMVNHSKHGDTRVDVSVGIAYKEDIAEARRVILDSLVGLAGALETPPPEVVVTELGDSSVNLSIRVWIASAEDEPGVYAATVERVKIALDAANIQIPFPHMQLFIDDMEERVVDKLKRARGGASS